MRLWIALPLILAAFTLLAEDDAKPLAVDDPARPNLEFFGARIYADDINPLTGEAEGRVYIDGTALNAKEPKFPVSVEAGSLKVDLENGKITLSGWPKLTWPSAKLISTAASTVITLERNKYHVNGPASYQLDLNGLKQFQKP